MPVLKLNHALLVPWILLTIPPAALFQQQLLLIATLAPFGVTGMLVRNKPMASAVSASLLVLIIWGKIAGDLYGLTSPDSALLLLQFMVVILLMEASNTELIFDKMRKRLEGRNDETSTEARARVVEWARGQLLNIVKLTTVAFLLSLGLLVLGSFLSVSIDQIAFSGTLVLVAVVALLILLTYRREPEKKKARLA